MASQIVLCGMRRAFVLGVKKQGHDADQRLNGAQAQLVLVLARELCPDLGAGLRSGLVLDLALGADMQRRALELEFQLWLRHAAVSALPEKRMR